MRNSKEDGFVNLQSSQSIERGRLLSIANEADNNVANTDQKKNEHNLKLMNGTAGQQSSALGSFWNDPYGAQNDQKFAAMYKESFEFQPSNVSASKESLNLKL